MSGSLSKDGNAQAEDAQRIQYNGGINGVAKLANAEEIDENMGDQDHGQYTQGLSSRRRIAIADFSRQRNQIRKTKINSSGYADLAEQVEPATVNCWRIYFRLAT